MKLFCPEFKYNPVYRAHLFPLLKLIITGDDAKKNQIINESSIALDEFCMTSEISKADRVILPMSWNYYVKVGKKREVLELIEIAQKAKKIIWLVLLGDVGLPVPDFKHVIVFRSSGYASKLPSWHLGLPVFISDPYKYNTPNIDLSLPGYREKPIVGFCGLASNNAFNMFYQLIKTILKNIAYYLKVYKHTPESLVVAPYLRYTCLKQLESSSQVLTNFILRKKYRAGAITRESRDKSTKEYFNNMATSQYILCIRGAGNFSTRLYETLAMGRIPIYLHTDGLLPFSDKIDWKNHMVWVDWNERYKIVEKILMFHQKLTPQGLKILGERNRNLWESYFKTEVFFKKHLS